MLIVNAEVGGRPGRAVRVHAGRVAAIGDSQGRDRLRPLPGEEVVDARGGLLLPGLHDHHVHLLALAAAAGSVQVGPPAVGTPRALAATLRAAARRTPPGGWVRAVGYHESVAGELDRALLDRLVPDVPARVQHRSGALWVLNSAGLAALARAARSRPDVGGHSVGEHDDPRHGTGRQGDGGWLPADGRLFRQDERLGRLLELAGAGGGVSLADLAAVGARLASHGVTGVTDATATTGPPQVALLGSAVAAGALGQRLVLTGPPDLAGQVAADAAEGRAPAHPTTQEATGRAATTDDRTTSAGLITGAGMAGPAAAGRAAIGVGPVKILLDDDQPTGPDEVADTVRAAREWGRRVAFHCVTRVQLVIALAALDAAGGALPGDRIEHAAVLPPDLVELVRAASLTVVTQPHFVAERGDAYLADVDPDDLPWLYRCAGLIAAGVPVAAGTDAPFGGADPWASMRAAVRRRTPSGQLLGPAEALPAARALGLYLGDAATAGGPPRRVAPGAPADLCLLDVPGRAVLADLDPGPAVLTVAAGRVIHRAR